MRVWCRYAQQVYSTAWENLSRSFVARSERLRHLAVDCGYWLPAGRWWHKTEVEWDVVSGNGDGTKALLGEAKWSEKPFGDKEIEIMAERIKHRTPPMGISENPCFVLFLPSIENNSLRADTLDSVEIVTAEDIVAIDA